MCAGTKEEIDEYFASLSSLALLTNDNYIEVEDIEDPIKSFTVSNMNKIGNGEDFKVQSFEVELKKLVSYDRAFRSPQAEEDDANITYFTSTPKPIGESSFIGYDLEVL